MYGEKAFRQAVAKAATMLKSAFLADYVVLGGGNAKELEEIPEGCRRGGNQMPTSAACACGNPSRTCPPWLFFLSQRRKPVDWN